MSATKTTEQNHRIILANIRLMRSIMPDIKIEDVKEAIFRNGRDSVPESDLGDFRIFVGKVVEFAWTESEMVKTDN